MIPAAEQIVAMTNMSVLVGTLSHPYVKLILDNQSTSSVVISIQIDGGALTQWKTFAAGEALVLDGDLYTFPLGTQFFGNGAANGDFSISYTYINQ